MVKNNESKVEITKRNIKYYKDRNYNCNINDIISVSVDIMPKKSHNKVIAICELCGNEKELEFHKYNANKDRQGYYSCLKCSENKRKVTTKEKYGVEYFNQLDIEKERMKKWMSSNEFKEKSKEKIKEVYGVEHFSKTEDYKHNHSFLMKKIIKDKKEKGIYDCPFSCKINKELRESAMVNKYGAKYSFNIPEIKKKIQDKNLEKFGHISPFGNKEIREKIKENIVYKYKGVVSKYIDDIYNKNEYRIYRRKIRYRTDLLRNELFKNWNGYDYYDGEYIRDYLELNKNNSKYPSIDHKISCFYGFINNIEPDVIANVDNLCITKKRINSSKREKLEEEFKEILKLDI